MQSFQINDMSYFDFNPTGTGQNNQAFSGEDAYDGPASTSSDGTSGKGESPLVITFVRKLTPQDLQSRCTMAR